MCQWCENEACFYYYSLLFVLRGEEVLFMLTIWSWFWIFTAGDHFCTLLFCRAWWCSPLPCRNTVIAVSVSLNARNPICRSTLLLQSPSWKYILVFPKSGVWVHVIRRDEQGGVFVITGNTILWCNHSRSRIIFRLVHRRMAVAHVFTRHQFRGIALDFLLDLDLLLRSWEPSHKDRQLAAGVH